MKIKFLLENLSMNVQRLEKKFSRDEALKQGMHKMSGYLQKEHSVKKEDADYAAKSHFEMSKIIVKFSKPEYISRDSSD